MSYFPQYFRFSSAKTYNGLINQGSTCYLNSVLQVFYMTTDFREAVERHASENPHTEYVDQQLKALFDDLNTHKAVTDSITGKLGIQRVFEQGDAAECYEKILNLTSDDASQIFHGQLTHRSICSACGTETSADGPFWSLPLALTGSTSNDYCVTEGIKEFFRDTEVRGENQMYCDTCDAKADSTIKCEMKHHPEVLMLLLKRFEFDYYYMGYVKINCNVDVPRTLQIPENQKYELYAVVDHSGDLRGGHYTATIQSQDDKTWYTFNDTDVRPMQNFQPFKEKTTEKSYSAYLLFYKKVHEEINQEPSPVQSTSHNYEKIEELKEAAEVEIEVVNKEADGELMKEDVTGRNDGRIGDDEDVPADVTQKTMIEKGVTCTTYRLQDVNLETQGEEEKLLKDVEEDEKQKRGDNKDVQNTDAVQGESRKWTEDQELDSRGQVRPRDEHKTVEETQPDAKSRSDKPSTGFCRDKNEALQANASFLDVRQSKETKDSNEEKTQEIGHIYSKPVSVDKQGDQERTLVDKAGQTVDVHEQKKGTSYDPYKSTEHHENQRSVDVRQTKERMLVHGNGDKKGKRGDSKHTENREMRDNAAEPGHPGVAGSRRARESQDDQQDPTTRCESVKGGQKSDARQQRKLLVKITDEEEKWTPTGVQRTREETMTVIEIAAKTPQGNKNERNVSSKHDPEQSRLTEDVEKLIINRSPLAESARKRRREADAAAQGDATEHVRKQTSGSCCFPSLRKRFKAGKGKKGNGMKRWRSRFMGCFPLKRAGQSSGSE